MPLLPDDFSQLETVRFQQKMKPAALKIYTTIWPGCRVEDLRQHGVKVHILDKEFGIDALLVMPSDQWLSIQEKYRGPNILRKYGMQFTQEYMNAAGTQYESQGEWFKLGAQLYFTGWSNDAATAFEKWIIMDVAKYKLLVERAGGLTAMGNLIQNRRHGRSNFFAINSEKLRPAIIYSNCPGLAIRCVAA